MFDGNQREWSIRFPVALRSAVYARPSSWAAAVEKPQAFDILQQNRHGLDTGREARQKLFVKMTGGCHETIDAVPASL